MKNTITKQYNCVNPFNFIRSISVICVFLLHTSLFSGQLGFAYDKYTWPLKTPAWSAVWMLFILSGYFIGKGFAQKRYTFSIQGIFKFYLRRLIKVGIPTWIFIFICSTVVEPEFIYENPTVILRVLTFTYYNIPASNCIGATWYVSTLMQLYMVAPFICVIAANITKHIKKYMALKISISLVAILAVGFFYRYHMFKIGADWSTNVYVPFYANLDLYISGILLNYISFPEIINKTKKIIWNICAKIGLLVGILINCYIAYRAEYFLNYLYIYQYVLPSVYLIGVCIYIKISEICLLPQEPLNIQNIVKNPMRILDMFSDISFEFYLVHSMVISQIYNYFIGSNLIFVHLKIIFSSFIISIVWSGLLKKTFGFLKKGREKDNAV